MSVTSTPSTMEFGITGLPDPTPPPTLPSGSATASHISSENDLSTPPTGTSKSSSKSSSKHHSKSKSLDARQLRDIIHKLNGDVRLERERREEAERRVVEVSEICRATNDKRVQLMQEVVRLQEELKLYELQYERARNEIRRAQEVINNVDQKRYDAEKEAAEARSTARKLKEEMAVYLAREEGRRAGWEEGIRRGRELGYHEGLRQGAANATPQDTRSSDPRPQEPVPPQPQHHPRSSTSRPASRATSSRPPSRAPSAAPGSSTIRAPRPTYTTTYQDITPVPEEVEPIRPISVRNITPSPRLPSADIPPDNFIPAVDEAGRIRIPPPFEFTRPPPTPEPPQDDEQPRMVPPPIPHSMREHYYRPPSAASHASTTVSQMDMISNPGPYPSRTPMSAIPEVATPQSSPLNPRDAVSGSVRQQTSFASASARMTPRPSNMEPIYARPRTGSMTSSRPPSVQPNSDHRRTGRTSPSTRSTTPGIFIESASTLHPSSSSEEPPVDPRSLHRISLSNHPNDGVQANTSLDSDPSQPPVIPDRNLYTRDGVEDEDDAVSSGMGTEDADDDPLRTPLMHRSRPMEESQREYEELKQRYNLSHDHPWAAMMRTSFSPAVNQSAITVNKDLYVDSSRMPPR